MGGSRDAVEDIRSRLNVVDLISEYVTVQRSGKNFKCLCPFHAEKTPSFTIREEFQTWHCFGCGEHGDIFSFLMKIENLTFPEALERLAKRAGVDLEPTRDQRPSRKELIVRTNALASSYYSELLKRTPTALEYLRNRGLADKTIEQFRLGYAAPAWEGLVQYLSKKGVDLADAAEAGLVRKGERGTYYDWFRHRIVFPILDIQERVIAFGGRALVEDQPKYLNSPDTPVFSKTRSLYGLHLARKNISDNGLAVVVEGYMDVITAHQAGFANCVATLGTALTDEHIKILSRYTEKVVLAYDADSAGMKAALRGASMFEEAECDVRIVKLPKGDDPDSLIRQGRTSDFAAAVSGALPLVDYKLSLLMERHDLSSAEGRSGLLKDAMKVLAQVRTYAEREQHIKTLARYHPNFDTGTTRAEDHIRRDIEALVQRKQSPGGTPVRTVITGRRLTALDKAERGVLKALLSGDLGNQVCEAVTADDFSGDVSRRAAAILFEKFREKKGIYLPEVLGNAEPDIGTFLSELAMQETEPITDEFLQGCVTLIKNSRLKKSRTSDVFAPYMKDGTIDPSKWPHGQTATEYEEFLRKTGKKPPAGGQ